MAKKTIRDIDLKGKKVLIRVDFNVPMLDGKITDDNRIVQAIPTIQYALDQGAKVILFSHLGRVASESDKQSNSLYPVALKLASLLKKDVKFVAATRGKALEQTIAEMQPGEIVMFENTRFEDIDGKKESKNNPEQKLPPAPDRIIVFVTLSSEKVLNISVSSSIISSSREFLFSGLFSVIFFVLPVSSIRILL